MENNKPRLFEITFYSVDSGCLTPEISWNVEFNSSDEAMERCAYLSNKYKGGIFMCRPLAVMSFKDFTNSFIESEFELL